MTRPYEVAVRAEAELGEGPTWDAAAGRLLWIDILGSRLHTYDPDTGRRTVRRTEQHIGAVKPRAGGGLVLNLRDGVGLLDPDGGFGWLHHEPVPGHRANDAAVAPDGALWAGTMRYDEAPGGGTLSRVTGDGSVAVVLDDVAVSNGTGWSPDGRLMYYIDSPTRRVDVFDHADGRISGRRTLVEIEESAGFPDGLTVDAEGCVWVALWQGSAVRRYTPDGELDRVIELPVPLVTACAFGGAGLTDLYVTTARVGLTDPPALAGSLFVVPGAGKGLAQPVFAG
ncbi:SMP-30/gluconolactonase/LRE family protein [Streptomyces sp. 378]|uniref:SMP-30/gluconolactonase/LRE family protein n=1 Tax=Streptomyces sp. 378 TaxID=3049412 RepID=UPI0024C33180|nr:SMP-30/gluconolactonase/LRE family protein [Streptomyces sp. 378]MDK1343932.1 SMP-30/gluconolactonase/LRE family protein [Streptomyces sp. 378]